MELLGQLSESLAELKPTPVQATEHSSMIIFIPYASHLVQIAISVSLKGLLELTRISHVDEVSSEPLRLGLPLGMLKESLRPRGHAQVVLLSGPGSRKLPPCTLVSRKGYNICEDAMLGHTNSWLYGETKSVADAVSLANPSSASRN